MRTFSLFRHETSLREQRLLRFEDPTPVNEPSLPEAEAQAQPQPASPESVPLGTDSAEKLAADTVGKVTEKRDAAATATQEQKSKTEQFELIAVDINTPEIEKGTKDRIEAELQNFPEILRGPLAQVMEGMDMKSRKELHTLMTRVSNLDNATKRMVFSFSAPDGTLVIPKGAEDDPKATEAIKFVDSLTPPEKEMHAKVVRASHQIMKNIETGGSLDLDLNTPETQAKIVPLLENWKKAQNVEAQMLVEASLEFAGVDTGLTPLADIDTGSANWQEKVTIRPKNERWVGMLVGCIKFCMGILGQLEGKKTATEKQIADANDAKDQPPAQEVPSDQREQEIKTREKQLADAGKKEADLKKEIENVEKKEDAPGSDLGSLSSEKGRLKMQLKELQTSMETLRQRLYELKTAQLAAKPKDGLYNDVHHIPSEEERQKRSQDLLKEFKMEAAFSQVLSADEMKSLIVRIDSLPYLAVHPPIFRESISVSFQRNGKNIAMEQGYRWQDKEVFVDNSPVTRPEALVIENMQKILARIQDGDIDEKPVQQPMPEKQELERGITQSSSDEILENRDARILDINTGEGA